jgi:hypothetical protein
MSDPALYQVKVRGAFGPLSEVTSEQVPVVAAREYGCAMVCADLIAQLGDLPKPRLSFEVPAEAVTLMDIMAVLDYLEAVSELSGELEEALKVWRRG